MNVENKARVGISANFFNLPKLALGNILYIRGAGFGLCSKLEVWEIFVSTH